MTHPCTPLLAALALSLGFTTAWAQTPGAAATTNPPAGASQPASSPVPAPAAKPAAKSAATVPASTTNTKAPATAAKPAAVTAPVNPSAVPPPTTVVKPAASAPYKGKPTTRPLTADEERESAMAPGELRPERVIVPQVSIPLGKKSGDSSATSGKSGGSVHDAAGRCAAIADENERAICRERAGLGTAVRK